MQLSRLVSDFIRYRASRGIAQATCNNDQLACDQLVAWLRSQGSDDDVKHFDPEAIEGFIGYLHGVGMKGSSINLKISSLSALGKYGTKAKDGRGRYILNENPVIRIERPKREKGHERYLFKDEVNALLAVDAPGPERLALAVLYHHQLRATAFCAAKVRDLAIDGERVQLSVVEKGGNHDTFTLLPELAEPLLQSLKLREAGKDEPLFVNSHGRGYTRTGLSEMVRRLAKRAGITRIPVRAHVFARHTPASLLGQDGASVFEIAAVLRHRDPSTAKRYVHGVRVDEIRARAQGLLR